MIPSTNIKSNKLIEESHERRSERLIDKRKTPNDGGVSLYQSILKKPKYDRMIVPVSTEQNPHIHQIIPINERIKQVKRTSQLASPMMVLEGHEAPLLTARFNPKGTHIASAGFDRNILLWEVYGETRCILICKGHKGAITQIRWLSDETQLLTSCSDGNAFLWDMDKGEKIRKFQEHIGCVNACAVSGSDEMLATVGDDCCVNVWDRRVKYTQKTIKHPYSLTSVEIHNNMLYSAGIDEVIRCWDLRKAKDPSFFLGGHTNTVTGLSISNDKNSLLSNSMDNTLRLWDIRPYSKNRAVGIFNGHTHSAEQLTLRCNWGRNDKTVTAGSADKNILIWDAYTKRLLHKIPGHQGSVIETDLHPIEPIISSCSMDNKVLLTELH